MEVLQIQCDFNQEHRSHRALLTKINIFFKGSKLEKTHINNFDRHSKGERYCGYYPEKYRLQCSLPETNVIKELDSVATRIQHYSEPVIQKALLFSAFSITECYVRSLVWSKIPMFENGVLEKGLEEVLKRHLTDKLSKTSGRQEIYYKFTGKKLGCIPHNEPFRNSLAHDIGNVHITNGKIIVRNQKNQEYKEYIDVIMSDLKRYVSEIN